MNRGQALRSHLAQLSQIQLKLAQRARHLRKEELVFKHNVKNSLKEREVASTATTPYVPICSFIFKLFFIASVLCQPNPSHTALLMCASIFIYLFIRQKCIQ